MLATTWAKVLRVVCSRPIKNKQQPVRNLRVGRSNQVNGGLWTNSAHLMGARLYLTSVSFGNKLPWLWLVGGQLMLHHELLAVWLAPLQKVETPISLHPKTRDHSLHSYQVVIIYLVEFMARDGHILYSSGHYTWPTCKVKITSQVPWMSLSLRARLENKEESSI